MSATWISNVRINLIIILLISVFVKLHSEESSLKRLPDIYKCSQESSKNLSVSVDFLAWLPSEEVASIWADVISIGNNTSTWEALGFNFKWDYGFRIGAGYGLQNNQWDMALYWTWFHTDAKHEIPFKHNASISPEFFAAFLSGDTPQSMSAKWSLLLNILDWELGQNFWISKMLLFRPFLGIKFGCINQSIHAQYYNLSINKVLTNNSGSEFLKNNFWGIGPLIGINTKWMPKNFASIFFNFFGDFSIATMWGTWVCSDVYKNTAFKTSSVNMKNSTLGALMFRGFMGIEWNVNFTGKPHFSAKLGYEMQLWLNQLRLATFQLQRLHADLSLQGVTVNCQFDF
ncbi:MAG: Lpg1974 family pore-forming outer membrane protein [Parachlamydiales bacterium]